MSMLNGERLFYCATCMAMVTSTKRGELKPCVCGSRYFVQPEKLEWRPTPSDKRFLRSLRIGLA